MTPQIDLHLSDGVLQHFQKVKGFVNERVHSLTNSAQQVGESLKETATQATDRVIDTATTTLEQAKGSLEQGLQTAEQVKNTTSVAVKTALASSINDWLTQHPIFLKLFQILGWAANHPIISCVILLFMLALVWSIIKAIIRLIETASWSILKFPLKLLQALMTVILTNLGRFAVQKINFAKQSDNDKNLISIISPTIYQGKQQRLAEISHRLKVIQKEQDELLQEAAELISGDTIDINVEEITFNNSRN
jgi:hypothetical protein